MNFIQRWITPFVGSFVVLVVTAFAIPVRNFIIEPQPNGTGLGEVPSGDLRVIGIMISSVPLVATNILVVSLRRRVKLNPWICAVPALAVALMILAYILHTYQN